jgi:transcriptional regulator GlxA family with amidase domain
VASVSGGDDPDVTNRPRQVVVLAFDRMQLLDIVGPAELLDAATQALRGHPGYQVKIATLDGKPVRGSSGMRLHADLALPRVRPRDVDTLIVGGGMQFEHVLAVPGLAREIERVGRGARRTCSVCTGAFLLASAGLLDGKSATTHWAFCTELARRYARVTVLPDRIFVRDGQVMTSAGVTAGMDLALALIEEDHGAELARTVAQWTVMFLQRPGGQSKFSKRLAVPAAVPAPLRDVLDAIATDPAGDHRLATLAPRAAMSERHFRRIFAEQTGTTPARYVESVRVEAARHLLEAGAGSIELVATSCGFGNPETLRRAFLRITGIGPSEYKLRFRTSSPAEPAV